MYSGRREEVNFMLESRRKYYFLAIAESLNITRAAEKLMISQPSLTQYLNQLEKELNAKLIDRKYSPLRLTPAGQIYYDYLRDAQSKEQEMHAEIAAVTAGDRMPLRIGIPLQKSQNVTETILPYFTAAWPLINYSIWEGTTTTVRNRVIQNELDIGFGHTQLEGDPECDVVPLRTERVVLVCSRQNPIVGSAEATLEHPLPIRPDMLTGLRFTEMAPEYILHDVEKEMYEKYRLKPGRIVVMSHLYSRVADVLSHPDTGVSFLPDYIFQENFPRSVLPQLAILRLGDEDYIWHFSMIRKKGKTQMTDARRFWNCIADLAERPE